MTTTEHRKAYRRKSYDSTTAADTPKDGDLYLGYVDGLYANVVPMQRRHPGKTIVGITVNGGSLDAQMADVEEGDLTPTSGAAWAKRKKDRGQIGTLYFPASLKAAIDVACRKLGLTPGKDVLYFAAQYDGDPTIPEWAVGKQYLHGDKNHPGAYSGGHFDVSSIRRYWPGVDPKPVPKHRLSRRSAFLARHLLRRLSKRTHPVDGYSAVLLARLGSQINRVLNLKG